MGRDFQSQRSRQACYLATLFQTLDLLRNGTKVHYGTDSGPSSQPGAAAVTLIILQTLGALTVTVSGLYSTDSSRWKPAFLPNLVS